VARPRQQLDAGHRGWAEVGAADDFVLRTEWSLAELALDQKFFLPLGSTHRASIYR
jgi:hypothetical protein